MSLNPTFCAGCRDRGTELGLLRADNERLRVKLSLAYAKADALGVEVDLLHGLRRDVPRRDVLASPMLGRPPLGQW